MAVANFFIADVSASDKPLVSVFSDDIKFSESVYPYDDGIFISNFGSESINPRPDENNGYIIYRDAP